MLKKYQLQDMFVQHVDRGVVHLVASRSCSYLPSWPWEFILYQLTIMVAGMAISAAICQGMAAAHGLPLKERHDFHDLCSELDEL